MLEPDHWNAVLSTVTGTVYRGTERISSNRLLDLLGVDADPVTRQKVAKRDRSVRLWDVATGRQIGPTMRHDGLVSGAVLNRDETRIMSWSWDSTVRLWDVAWRGRNLFEIACNHSPPDHILTAVSAQYGIKIDDLICQPDKVIPFQ